MIALNRLAVRSVVMTSRGWSGSMREFYQRHPLLPADLPCQSTCGKINLHMSSVAIQGANRRRGENVTNVTKEEKGVWLAIFSGRLLADATPDRTPEDRIQDAREIADLAMVELSRRRICDEG